jgi:hypothetical protein
MNIITDRPERAFVSTKALADMEDTLICDGATSTLIKSLEDCTLVPHKWVLLTTVTRRTMFVRCPRTETWSIISQGTKSNWIQSNPWWWWRGIRRILLSSTRILIKPNHYHLWVSTQVFLLSNWNKWVQPNLRSNRDMSYGAEGWGTAQTEIFETQLNGVQDWKTWKG